MRNRKLLLSVLLFAVIGMMTNIAISAPYFDMEQDGWTEIGPNNYSGRARAAIFDKFNDGVVYVGTVGGLYVSVNYGRNWQEITLDGTVQNVTALAQADDGTLYVGTGEGYYQRTLHREDPTGHSNHPSGKVGNGVFKQNTLSNTCWVANLSTDEDKYAYIQENFTFTQLTNTKPDNKYATMDDWAFINTMLYYNGGLYVGTKNGGLKYSSDNGASFTNIPIEGNNSFEVMDIVVNANGRIAVAYDNAGGCVALNNEGSATAFTPIFNSTTAGDNSYAAFGIGRIKLDFGKKNPNNLFIYASVNLANASSSLYTDQNGMIYGIYRPADEQAGITNISTNPTSWKNITTETMASMQGTTLGYGMSIYVDDNADEEQIYLGGNSVMVGQDYNGEGIFSFSSLTSAYSADTLGMNVGINVHNILPMPNPKTQYDSIYMLITTDNGVFTYRFDSIIRLAQWWPGVGFNNLQSYKVTASADGSVFAATQSNAIIYIPTVGDTIKRGQKIWSVTNANYPLGMNSTDYSTSTFSGSAVAASAIYKTTPEIRKPVILSRPGTNLARTYSNTGDYDAIDDQTWTYGHSNPQTLMSMSTSDNLTYDQFNTPLAFWESFDFNGTIDSVEMDLTNYTTIHRNGTTLDCRNGREIEIGDSILVMSDNLGYPFFHVMQASDIDGISSDYDTSYTMGSGNVLFYKNANMKIKIPQPVQARTLIGTNTGAFLCGKILDFSRTFDTSSTKFGDLTWVKLYTTGTRIGDNPSDEDALATMNRRIHAVALSQDGSSAFLALDVYSSFTTYDHTELIRISGLNDVDINNDRVFVGISTDADYFTTATIATFPRQISSIACDPNNSNNMVITFEGYTNEPNVMRSTNVLSDSPSFTDISLKIDRTGATATQTKPVFTALYEGVANSNRVYIGSDDGIYYTTNGSTWTAETDVPDVAVYSLWQQTKKLPKYTFVQYTGENGETQVFESTKNTGVIYAATYGKGLLVNRNYADTTSMDEVSIAEVLNKKAFESLSIYPNPATSQATINYTLSDASNVVLRMFDLNGREVSSFSCGSQGRGTHNQVLNVQSLQRGVYMIQMITDNSVKSAKLIVK